ncbi:MAG TPA: flagellar hook assembly protein FlgD [Pseudomonadales bacterium]|nr:flagellar hook assembly protein FlgD [Pseudomonadales bacterium]
MANSITGAASSTSDRQSIIDALNGKTSDTSSKSSSSTKDTNAANKNEFLQLMIAQLKNQDPLSPQDGTAFLSQLAQFSQVDGIQQLNTTMSDMASSYRSSQALQASALVGRSVQVESGIGDLGATGEMNGTVNVPSSAGAVNVEIIGADGSVLKKLSLGQHGAGDLDFKWDGTTDAGTRAKEGSYSVYASTMIDGKETQLKTYLSSNVDSVTIDKEGSVMLNVANVGTVSLDEVKKID